MFVHEVIQHRFMLDINDFQTKKDLLTFHNHLSSKIRKCYVEHAVTFSYNFLVIICGLLDCQSVQRYYKKNSRRAYLGVTYIALHKKESYLSLKSKEDSDLRQFWK